MLVLNRPFTTEELIENLLVRGDGLVSGVVRVDLSDVIDRDYERFLDLISELLTGTDVLMDVGYEVVGHEPVNYLLIEVQGDPSGIFELRDVDPSEISRKRWRPKE